MKDVLWKFFAKRDSSWNFLIKENSFSKQMCHIKMTHYIKIVKNEGACVIVTNNLSTHQSTQNSIKNKKNIKLF